ncbi:NAD(P)-dependent dehydrogenase (short-subunit alcohol dehydrogenase family) [Streptomyces sp. 3330]|uniref:SDR family oxidoreductase n=1 Tax=Streptomyces sp. 3330 TaxID=2817755 RepID=UPI00286446C1|nr:SDR family oxidoreductase [Streptomyces sp. 3330]MDR6974388.1 NAD(P)-dependent dehydrogenase (short-subunit alcohol dehydrogenase family) [Streptomyces sp. 3330]
MHVTPGGGRVRGVPGTVLSGRVAVVTGAARGVGEALARRLSRAGMLVALVGREEETLRLAAASLPNRSVCIEADVTDSAALDRAAQQVSGTLGRASVVVANAGIATGGPFARTPAELWQRVVDVNLTGSANTARAFLPHLTETRGYFLQIASTAAFGSAPMMSAYCASKAGAESFALALRGEVEPDGITVGIAYLHWTGTDMVTGISDHPVLQALRRNQPRFAQRVHAPAQVADWLTAGIIRRSRQIYAPPWLRWCQPLRPAFPPIVTHLARRELRRLSPTELAADVGVLGAGGRADWDAHRSSTRPPLDE